MKQFRTILFMLAAFTLVLTSCKKDSNKPNSAASITFKLNGASQSTTNVVGTYIKSENTIQVIGNMGNGIALQLMVENVKTGSFDLADINQQVLATYTTGSQLEDIYVGGTGNITITSFNSTSVSGTFQFVATNTSNDSKTISNGTFTAKLIQQ
ncbi:MAG: hypothetical protein ACTHJ8_20255 [Mucilaginibacter sp.]